VPRYGNGCCHSCGSQRLFPRYACQSPQARYAHQVRPAARLLSALIAVLGSALRSTDRWARSIWLTMIQGLVGHLNRWERQRYHDHYHNFQFYCLGVASIHTSHFHRTCSTAEAFPDLSRRLCGNSLLCSRPAI
jgi:hypothetical protein